MKMKKSRSGKAAETVPLPLSPRRAAGSDSRERTADALPYAIPAILFEGDESDLPEEDDSDSPAPALGPVPERAPSPAAQAGHVELEADELPEAGRPAETAPPPPSLDRSAKPESPEPTVEGPPSQIPSTLPEGAESNAPAPAVGPVPECLPSPPAQTAPGTPASAGSLPEYALDPAAQIGPDAVEATGLPEAYGTRTLLLTAQAPHWLYAHWDIAREEQRQHSAPADVRQLVLRVYEREVSGSPAAQIQVQPETREWFAYVPRAATQYVAELGCSCVRRPVAKPGHFRSRRHPAGWRFARPSSGVCHD